MRLMEANIDINVIYSIRDVASVGQIDWRRGSVVKKFRMPPYKPCNNTMLFITAL